MADVAAEAGTGLVSVELVAEALRARESGAVAEAERLEEAEAAAVAGFWWRGAAVGTAEAPESSLEAEDWR